MKKIFVFLVIFPFAAIFLFKGVMIFEYITKSVYIKDCVDNICNNVRLTGCITDSEYNEFYDELNLLADFSGTDNIVFRKGKYNGWAIVNETGYTPGEDLDKGDSFSVYVISSSVSTYSLLENGGVSADDNKNLYFKAKAQCRVELYK